jgi:hexokinase
METIKEIPKLKGRGFADEAEIAINCEWVRNSARLRDTTVLTPWPQGAFDSFKHEHLPRTKYDIVVDETSNKPGEQAFEVDTHAHAICRSLTASVRNSSLGDI